MNPDTQPISDALDQLEKVISDIRIKLAAIPTPAPGPGPAKPILDSAAEVVAKIDDEVAALRANAANPAALDQLQGLVDELGGHVAAAPPVPGVTLPNSFLSPSFNPAGGGR